MTTSNAVKKEKISSERAELNVYHCGRDRGTEGPVLLLIHGNLSSAEFFGPCLPAFAERLPGWLVVAPSLRGFGGSTRRGEGPVVDASRGLRDYSDDLSLLITALAPSTAASPVVALGWSLGGGVAMQLAIDDVRVQGLVLEAPVSPCGFGKGPGSGGGSAHPEFVAKLSAGKEDAANTPDPSPFAPRHSLNNVVKAPGNALLGPTMLSRRPEDGGGEAPVAATAAAHGIEVPGLEDTFLASMFSTDTASLGAYPGDSVKTKKWPGFVPGSVGVLNALSGDNFSADFSKIQSVREILWIRGSADIVVADGSAFEMNQLGATGVVPGWPGEEIAKPQQMISETRHALQEFGKSAADRSYTEVVFEDVGHGPHVERPDEFCRTVTDYARQIVDGRS